MADAAAVRDEGRPRITGVVHTRNEEKNIARALRSLAPMCDELLVADMGSTDRTRLIAEEFGARVLVVPEFGYVEPARALALAEVGTDWVITIDADEVIPPSLARRLVVVATDEEADAVNVARLNFMFGAPLRATGWAPDRHWFFFRRNALAVPDLDGVRIHVGLRPHGSARVLELPASDELSVWHFNYTDWAQFVTKLNRYTSIEASETPDDAVTSLPFLLRRLRAEVVDRGIRGKAWRDGYRGGALVALMCAYRLVTWLKVRQLREVGDEADIVRRYDRIADELLAEDRAELAAALR